MADIKKKGRLALKHDTEANWNKAKNFIPMKGEPIVYDPDESVSYSRIKIGDGVRTVIALPFASGQSDMEQADRNAPDFVKNRTHYREWKTYEKFEHLSMPGEQTVNDTFYPINKVYDLVLGETYTMTYEALDPSDNTTIIGTGTENIVAIDFSSLAGIEGYEDVVCLYSSELENFIFINGIYIIDADNGEMEKSDTNSYVLSATLLSDSEYPVRVILEGPGFATEGWEYTKLPQEYLPDDVTEKFEPINIEYEPIYEYNFRCISDASVNRKLRGECSNQSIDKVNPLLGAPGPHYYKIYEIDTENKIMRIGVSSNENLMTLEYTDYNDFMPNVNDVIAFNEDTLTENDITYLTFRRVYNGSSSSIFNNLSYTSFHKPQGYTKCKFYIRGIKVPDCEKNFRESYETPPNTLYLSSDLLSSNNDILNSNIVGFDYCDDKVPVDIADDLYNDSHKDIYDSFSGAIEITGSRNLYANTSENGNDSYFGYIVDTSGELIVTKDMIIIDTVTVAKGTDEGFAWEPTSDTTKTYGSSSYRARKVFYRKKDFTAVEDFRDIDLYLTWFFQDSQGQKIKIEWEK